jgi:hypothetical protein
MAARILLLCNMKKAVREEQRRTVCVGLGGDGVSVSGNGRQQKMKYKMFVPRVRKARRR